MMDVIERAVPGPEVEIVVQRRARRQILRDGPPLAAGAEDVHQAVDDLAHEHRALPAAVLGRWNERLRHGSIPRRSNRLGNVAYCGHTGGGSRSSTSVAPARLRPSPREA